MKLNFYEHDFLVNICLHIFSFLNGKTSQPCLLYLKLSIQRQIKNVEIFKKVTALVRHRKYTPPNLKIFLVFLSNTMLGVSYE